MLDSTVAATSRSNLSQRVIALGVATALLYWASSVAVTLVISVLLAYLLEPLVQRLEGWRLPRALAAAVVLVVATALLVALAWVLWDRIEHFAADWPRYRSVLGRISASIHERLELFERRLGELAAPPGQVARRIELRPERPLADLVVRGLGSLWSGLLAASFVPFLVFFMLARSRASWTAPLAALAPETRARAERAFADLSALLHGYVVGNLLVAIILSVASGLLFWAMGFDYPALAGLASGVLNLIPYLGVVLAFLPPFLLGLADLRTPGALVGVAAALIAFHLLSINFLMPLLVGHRARLNALAVTVALLFWGWLWGAIGLILAIPVTAAIRVACDHVPGLERVGAWLEG